jgi:hypothetical protein
MASQKEIQDLIGKAMADAEFGASLLADPAKAAKSLGYDLTEDQVAGFKASDLSSAEGLDERLSKYINLRRR